MFSRIRKRCTYANVAATMALFFAMSGGALAAGHYLITSTKQIKPSVLSSLKGKAGPAGKNGTSGSNGAQGAAGATGPIGPQGPAGSTGANGESVTSAEFEGVEGPCKKGGSEFKIGSAEPTYACNGSGGGGGGLPAVLPKGKTETGVWSVTPNTSIVENENNEGLASISFTIPLAAALPEANVIFEPHGYEGKEGEECPGNAAAPKAAEGFLCVYTSNDFEEEEHFVTSHGPLLGRRSLAPTGVVLRFSGEAHGFADGTWAVTAPEAG